MFQQDHVQIISEIGINHDGSLDKAIEMIEVSSRCGVDICKFQFLIAEEMYSKNAGTYTNSAGSFPIYDVIKKHEMPEEWIPELKSVCDKNQVDFLMTVCDLKGLQTVLKYEPTMLKIASSEINYLPLFQEIGKLETPLIFSSAGATLGDIEEALEALGRTKDVCLMHCNGKYPTPPEGANMNVLKTFNYAFPDLAIGYSDHTGDPVAAPIAAVSLGAKVIEKHFTLDKNSPGPDHSFAVDPQGLRDLVERVRSAEKAVKNDEELEINLALFGTSAKQVNSHEQYLRGFAHRSIFSACDIKKGEIFSANNLVLLRNGEQEKGMHPRELKNLIGLASPCAIPKGSPLGLKNLWS